MSILLETGGLFSSYNRFDANWSTTYQYHAYSLTGLMFIKIAYYATIKQLKWLVLYYDDIYLNSNQQFNIINGWQTDSPIINNNHNNYDNIKIN